MLATIRSKALLIEHSGLKDVVVSDFSSGTQIIPYSGIPAYEAEVNGSFILLCMDKERPTKWTATSENFLHYVSATTEL